MADKNQAVGSLGITQRWKEFVTGFHARIFGAILYSPNGDSLADDTADAVKTIGQAGTNNIGDVDVLTINAIAPQFDDTDKLAVSSYMQGATAGNTTLKANTDGTAQRVEVYAGNEAIVDADNSHYHPVFVGGSYIKFPSRPYLYNGSTWDRARSIASSGGGLGVQQVATLGELITLAASAARTTGANGTAVTGLGWRNRYIILLDVTNADTDAGDTLDVYIDVSLDGTTWLNAAHFTQVIGTDAARKEFAVLDPSAPGTSVINVTSDAAAAAVRPALFGPQMRARWAIVDAGAANVSFTFSVVAYAI